jgi:hypothetical protein
MLKKVFIFSITLLGLVLFFAEPTQAQCAMCKAVVEGAENGTLEKTGAGLNKGILYLMAVPYILLFLVFRKKIIVLFRQLF